MYSLQGRWPPVYIWVDATILKSGKYAGSAAVAVGIFHYIDTMLKRMHSVTMELHCNINSVPANGMLLMRRVVNEKGLELMSKYQFLLDDKWTIEG